MRSRILAVAVHALGASALLFLEAPASLAIVVDGETPANTSPPPDDPGWKNFCYLTGEGTSSGSAVYIGRRSARFPNGVLLSSRHLFPASGPGALEFRCNNGARFRVKRVGDAQRYEPLCVWRPGGVDGDRSQQPGCLLPEVGNLGRITDIVLLEPEIDPGAPDLELATQPPADGTPMLMMGEGNRAGSTVQPCVHAGAVLSAVGYAAASSNDVPRWGLNRVVFGSFAIFDPSAGEAIPAIGDSGGPAWIREVGTARWKLFGLAYTSVAGSPEQQACMRDANAPGNGPGASWSAIWNGELQLAARGRDSDDDGVSDFLDNCPTVPNPDQWNANHVAIDAVPPGDHFEYSWLHAPIPDRVYGAQEDGSTPPVAGNRCDGDFDESGRVSVADLKTLQACVKRRGSKPGPAADPKCSESDLNGSGSVGFADVALFRAVFGKNGQGM